MELKITAQNPMEWLAIKLNLIPTPLIDTQVAFTQARAIMAAAELNIFEAFGKDSKTYQQIAELCKTHPEATKQLLDCLTGIGYLGWSNDKYALKPKLYKWCFRSIHLILLANFVFSLASGTGWQSWRIMSAPVNRWSYIR